MPRNSFLGDMLTGLFEHSRRALGPPSDRRPLPDLCRALLASEGEVSGLRLSQEILGRYAGLDDAEKRNFFRFVNDDLELDVDALAALAHTYSKTGDTKDYRAMTAATEPPRQELFRRLNQSIGATSALVSMRVDLMAMLKEESDLKRTDLDFVHLLRSWFNRGFLVLQQINWDTPAAILEKIIDYEAVHTINDWDDLKRRTYPADRRCFAYFHPSMPGEPLIFVQVALTTQIPSSIQALLAEDRAPVDADDTDVAVFYSISNCQKGLQGISFGNLLIKQVVGELGQELPHLDTFVTLSPIPGLNRWLGTQDADERATKMLDARADTETIQTMTAHYLAEQKGRAGLPVDPVARFHLGNGAEVHAIHAGADLTENGWRQSGGTMVNYLYDLDHIERNHEQFVSGGPVSTSRPVAKAVAAYHSQKEKAESQ